jgi:hypothetical protein
MKAYNITGKQFQYIKTINAFDAICPVLLKDGRWVISKDTVDYLEQHYITDFAISGATEDLKDSLQILLGAVRKFPEINYEAKDLHPAQQVRRFEAVLEEKKIVEIFLKESIGTSLNESMTVQDVYDFVEAKPSQQYNPIAQKEFIKLELESIMGTDYNENLTVKQVLDKIALKAEQIIEQ